MSVDTIGAMCLVLLVALVPPTRRVDDDAADAARDEGSDGKSHDPSHVDPRNDAPVDRPPRAGAKSHADRRASNALRSRHGEFCIRESAAVHGARRVAALTEASGQDDGAGCAEFHGETARGRVQREPVAQHLHDVVAVGPDAESNTGTAKAPLSCQSLVSRKPREAILTGSRWALQTCYP